MSSDAHRNRDRIGWIAAVVLITLLLCAIAWPILDRMAHTSGRVPGADHLSAIWRGLVLYAEAHEGAAPAKLDDLVGDGWISDGTLRCDEPADARFARYRYTPPTPRLADWTAADVVAFDWPANHDNDGITVLFGDGHTEFVSQPDADRISALADAGVRPVRLAPASSAPLQFPLPRRSNME